MVELRNYMEDCVKDMLPSVIKNFGCCDCETCKLDIMAIVLNNVRPKYVVTRKGQLYARMSFLHRQFEIDILSEIAKAVKIVERNPRHDIGVE